MKSGFTEIAGGSFLHTPSLQLLWVSLSVMCVFFSLYQDGVITMLSGPMFVLGNYGPSPFNTGILGTFFSVSNFSKPLNWCEYYATLLLCQGHGLVLVINKYEDVCLNIHFPKHNVLWINVGEAVSYAILCKCTLTQKQMQMRLLDLALLCKIWPVFNRFHHVLGLIVQYFRAYGKNLCEDY